MSLLTGRIEILGRAATVLAFIVISYLAFTPDTIPVVDDSNDKFNHVLAFAVLAVGLVRFWRMAWWAAGLFLLVYGIGIELVQAYLPWRSASLRDVVADSVGIAMGVLIAKVKCRG